jgi:hypothetical protein
LRSAWEGKGGKEKKRKFYRTIINLLVRHLLLGKSMPKIHKDLIHLKDMIIIFSSFPD